MSARDEAPRRDRPREDLTRLRARFVMERIGGWGGRSWVNEAVQRVKSLPVQIRSQGLTVAVAVLLREGGASAEIARILAEWLFTGAPVKPLGAGGGAKTGQALLRASVEADRPSYLAAQREALGLLEELKLLADALYGGAS